MHSLVAEFANFVYIKIAAKMVTFSARHTNNLYDALKKLPCSRQF